MTREGRKERLQGYVVGQIARLPVRSEKAEVPRTTKEEAVTGQRLAGRGQEGARGKRHTYRLSGLLSLGRKLVCKQGFARAALLRFGLGVRFQRDG